MTVVAILRPGKREEFLDAMRSLQNDRMREKGMRSSTMDHGGDGNSFRLVEEWETAEDLKRYCNGESFKVFLGAVRTLCVQADFKYGSVEGQGGTLDLREARRKH